MKQREIRKRMDLLKSCISCATKPKIFDDDKHCDVIKTSTIDENGNQDDKKGNPDPIRAKLSFTTKNKATEEIWWGPEPKDIPLRRLGTLKPEVFCSYTGPENGLLLVEQLIHGNDYQPSEKNPCAGCKEWLKKSRKAYGLCLSLYDQHPVNGKISGDPIADAFAICARRNNCLMAIADGVNWGEKSKLAARCAIYGAIKHCNERLFGSEQAPRTTHDIMTLLRESLDAAHRTILQHEGGLTTLCVALVVPLAYCRQYAVCVVNLGDSLAFVFGKHHGIREVTIGSHDITSERDIRDAGGAIGPVKGTEPELNNLTCSMTCCDRGDIVFLTTDGITDNYDPVVTKLALAPRRPSLSDMNELNSQGVAHEICKPEMEPAERHKYSVKEMERVIHEFELETESDVSSQEMCGILVQHVLKLTDPKRKVLENPDLYGKKLRSKQRKERDDQIFQKMGMAAGKLDHASIVAYEVGTYRGNDDENYEDGEDEEFDEDLEDLISSMPPLSSSSNSPPQVLQRPISFETSM